jgi:hypothetical protein
MSQHVSTVSPQHPVGNLRNRKFARLRQGLRRGKPLELGRDCSQSAIRNPQSAIILVCLLVAACLVPAVPAALAAPATAPAEPTKVYVPYEKLRSVFEADKQGVFLPYDEFQRLWRAAQQSPAAVGEAPAPYLISSARFVGKVDTELARMQLELVVDILGEGWVEVPIGLGDVAVSAVSAPAGKPAPLLRVVDGQYVLLTRGKGRQTLTVDFARQLATQPGLNVLGFRTPPAAITTLELTIPDENMKVDVEPMLAASTDQVELDGKKATRLQAFLGATGQVKLSWKPKTQAAADLAAVVICEQLQHINVAEALISHDVTFNYDIRRRGVDTFTVQLPGAFRVTAVDGANISKWDIAAAGDGKTQTLVVNLFSPAKGGYSLTVRMELFLKDPDVKVPLTPIITREVLRRTGLIAVTHSPRRSVELADAKKLARVDTGRLPQPLAGQSGATAWRFITSDYAGTLAIGTVEPRITAGHFWGLGVDDDRMELRGQLQYAIERTGLFQVSLNLPEPWEVVSIGPSDLVDDHQFSGKGPGRMINILLKREVAGQVTLALHARAPRKAPDEPVKFILPQADRKNLQLYSGQLTLLLADRLRAEVDALEQFQPMPLGSAAQWSMTGVKPVMAMEFRSIDPAKPASASFKIAVKPAQVSAVVNRLVSIESGSIVDQALIDYTVLYAPVDTFYLKMPAALAEASVEISGPDIKEKPRIDKLPDDQATTMPASPESAAADRGAGSAESQPAGPQAGAVKWAYYKVVLQSPVIGRYRLRVDSRRSFQAGADGKVSTVAVEPIIAAGKLSDQIGYIAVAKADTLAIGEPKPKNLLPGDPTSAADVPEESYRKVAALAFRNNVPPFELSLPVAVQKEAAVFTTIATGAIIEQVLGRDGALNTNATYLLETSRGDRLAVTLPRDTSGLRVLLNGVNTPVEDGATKDVKIIRLPPSAGQFAKLVLELRYGMNVGRAGSLESPTLPDGIPVQQTFWRLIIPSEDLLLWFDNAFARLEGQGQGISQVGQMAEGYPSQVGLHFGREGQVFDFIRQGSPGHLHVVRVDQKMFAIAVWVLILVFGVAALKLSGFGRCVLLLAAVLAVVVIKLFAPLLARQLVLSGYPAGLIVLGLWLAHWIFRMLPRQVARIHPGSPPGPQKPAPGDPDPFSQLAESAKASYEASQAAEPGKPVWEDDTNKPQDKE